MNASTAATLDLTPRRLVATARGHLVRLVGGPTRLRVVAILAGVLALDGADKGTVSATASNLRHTFAIDNTRIGLLVSVSAVVTALATVPVGALTDSVRRTRLLAVSIVAWAAATGAGALAQSYLWLLVSRIALGMVSATAGPTIASLTGDYFAIGERARMYSFILGGELIGTGIGFAVSGWLANLAGWRATFGWLMLPGAALAVLVARLPEPTRGGQDPLPIDDSASPQSGKDATRRTGRAAEAVRRKHIKPYANQVLTEDPADASLWWAAKYILRVRTDVVIIIASALGYFYLTGVRTFAILFVQGRYGIAKGTASVLVLVIGVGALIGVFLGGRTSDRLGERGFVNARVILPAFVLLVLPAVLLPAFSTTQLVLALPLLFLGAGLLGAANPPQDAARLDIIHPHLWGRSEGVRSALRGVAEAAAPVTFGLVSDRLFGTRVGGSVGGQTAAVSAVQGDGLASTFLVFLVVVFLAGLIVLIGLRTYPRDVATAQASLDNTLGDRKTRRRRGQ